MALARLFRDAPLAVEDLFLLEAFQIAYRAPDGPKRKYWKQV